MLITVITIPDIFYAVVVSCTAAVEAVAVSGVLLKLVLLPGGITVPAWKFLFLRESLVLSLRLPIVQMLNSGLSGFRS